MQNINQKHFEEMYNRGDQSFEEMRVSGANEP